MIGKSLEGKSVLVTGASGFVGRHLALRLCRLGAKTRILVRESSSGEVVEELKRAGAEIFYGDVTDRESVFRAVEGVEFVFHIAALFRQAKHEDSVYFDVNVEGVRNVLDASEEFKISKVIHCSTIGVHSHIINPPADENEDYRPGDIYQLSKCEGEKLAKERFLSGKLNGIIIRPAMIWGEGDMRILKLFKGVAHRRFPIIGNGRTKCHWIYVHDLVNAFILAAEKEIASGEVFIIAGKEISTIEDLVNTVAEVAKVKPLPFKIPAMPVQLLGTIVEKICIPFGIEPPIYRRRVDFFTKDRAFVTKKAEKLLGFQAMQSFREEVANIYNWYQSQGLL